MSRLVESVDQGALTQATVGPVRWQAPELLQSALYSSKSDVWSFGVLIYEVVERQIPYGATTPLTQVAIGVANGSLLLDDVSNPFLNSVRRACMRRERDDRPSFKELCQWLGSPSTAVIPTTK
jgi:serine/threonine protein kinase